MSDSYTVLPLTSEVREWLHGEGVACPLASGRAITSAELMRLIQSLSSVQGKRVAASADCELSDSSTGEHTLLLVEESAQPSGPCEFHFRGSHVSLVVRVVAAIAALAGPQVIHAHSGEFTKVVVGP